MPLIITTPFKQEPGLPVPNATIWVRAGSIGLGEGASVTAWTNEGTLGEVFGGSGNTTYHTGVINGHPVVRGDGTSTMAASFPTFFSIIGAEEGTIYVVQKQVGTDDFNGTFGINGSIASNAVGALLSWSDTLYYDHGSNTTRRISVAQPGGWDDTFHYIELFRDGTSTAEINVDGVNLLTSSFGSAPPPSEPGGSVAMSLFGYGFQVLTGDIAELIIFKTALSAPDRALMISYLTTKYGL